MPKEHAVLGRVEAQRVDRLRRVLLRTLVGGEEVCLVLDDRPAGQQIRKVPGVVRAPGVRKSCGGEQDGGGSCGHAAAPAGRIPNGGHTAGR